MGEKFLNNNLEEDSVENDVTEEVAAGEAVWGGAAETVEKSVQDEEINDDVRSEAADASEEAAQDEAVGADEEIVQNESIDGKPDQEEVADDKTAQDESAERRTEEIIEHGSEEELMKLKSWLFRENVRIIMATKELEEMQAQFDQEKAQFQDEVKALNRKISVERQRLKEDSLFFEKKMDILKSGFAQLDMDRRRLEKEQAKFEAQKEVLEQPSYGMSRDVSAFFRGVKNPLALKKRYKDLIKIFHPDNVAGDKEIIQMINKEYENLKHDYEIGKWA